MPFDIDNPVQTKKYEHSGQAFLYVLGEPVYSSRDVEDVELVASNLRELFARYRQELEKEQPAKCGYCHRPAEHDGVGGPKCTYCDDMLANC